MHAKALGFKLLLILVILGVIEGAAYVTGLSLQPKGIFNAPHITESFQTFQTRLNPLLGWPSDSAFGKNDLDAAGSRIIPAYPDPHAPVRVSLYGDSFTWGEEVDNEHAWGNLLSMSLQQRVANYGVGGYGTDQSYLRFYHHSRDRARVVILGHLSENITRNVGQLRNLAVPASQCQLKPRFILGPKGELELVPLPRLTAQDFKDFQENPEKYLKYDYFLPGGGAGNQRLRFPYTLSVLRSLGRLHLRSRLLGEPHYADCYRPDHPARGLQITAAILKKFSGEARARGRHPLVLIFPTGYDLLYYRQSRKWVYQPLKDLLAADRITFLDVGEELMVRLGGCHPCEIFKSCETHLNEKGNLMVAEIVHDYLMGEPWRRLVEK